MKKIRFIINVLYLALSIGFIIILMYLFRPYNRSIRRIWGKITLKVLGITLQSNGELNNKAQMLIINHTSMLDIIVLEAIHPCNLCWIAKEEIRKIPFYGHILEAPRMIWIKREDKRELLRLLQVSKEKIEQGRVLAIFPEGTRNTTHPERLNPFKGGAKMIAEKNHLTVQAIVIQGTLSILNMKAKESESGIIRIDYLPLVSPLDDWYDTLKNSMQQKLLA